MATTHDGSIAGASEAGLGRVARRRLRILVLTSTFPRWAGDSEPRFVLDLCRHLEADAEILVLAPHTRGAARREIMDGVRVDRFRYFFVRWQGVAYAGGILARLRENPWRLLQLPLFFAASLLALRRAIRDWSPDLIHAHWIVPQGFVAALGAGKIPVLCTSHGGDLHGLRGRVLTWLKSWTLRRCAAITVVSESMKTHIRLLARGRLPEVIPMGTDLMRLFVPPAHVDRDPRSLLFVGRLVEKKGVSSLLDAMSEIRDPGLRLTVVGDGPQRESLRRYAEQLELANRVDFVGAVEHHELPDFYQRATLAVFPFTVAADGDQEGFGLVVVEAMGCGCPVIAGDLPALRQSIDPGITGLLTPPDDAGALAKVIERALADESLRNRLSASALDRARQRFDWNPVAAKYRQVIQAVVHR